MVHNKENVHGQVLTPAWRWTLFYELCTVVWKNESDYYDAFIARSL